MIAIYKREVKSYFQSMIGYAFIAFITLFTGIYFMAYNLSSGIPYFSYALSATFLMFLVAVPVLTMKSFAEERKSKTDQLLLTAPVKLTEIVLGKYLAMVTVFVIPNLIFCLYPLYIKAQGTAYFKVDYTSIAMFFVIGCVYIAIGMFLSALTESQIIAAVSTFAVLMILYLWSGLISFLPSKGSSNLIGLLVIISLFVLWIYDLTKNWVIGAALEGIAVVTCMVTYVVKSSLFENLLSKLLIKFDLAGLFMNVFENSLLNLSDIIFCLSLIFLFVFVTIQTIQKRRWS